MTLSHQCFRVRFEFSLFLKEFLINFPGALNDVIELDLKNILRFCILFVSEDKSMFI